MKNKLFNEYKYRANKSEREFTVDKNTFAFISQGTCYYYGIEFDKEYEDGKVNGVDRLNNNKGYTEDNCVPACWICNRAKNDLTTIEFYTWIKRLHTNFKHLTEPSLTMDQKTKEELKRHVRCNSLGFKSYEESVLSRAYNLLYSLRFPTTLITKIIRNVNNNKHNLKYLVTFIYKLDSSINPESTEYLLQLLGCPKYLQDINPSNIIDLRERKKNEKATGSSDLF